MSRKDKDRPLYLISIVSRILEVHPQTLRLYEKEGFVQPKRINRQRLYSENDLERLNFIIQLTRDLGVNKAGVDIILRMRQQLEILQQEFNEVLESFDDNIKLVIRERLRKALEED